MLSENKPVLAAAAIVLLEKETLLEADPASFAKKLKHSKQYRIPANR